MCINILVALKCITSFSHIPLVVQQLMVGILCYPQAPRQTRCSFLLYSTFMLNQSHKVFYKISLFIFQCIPSKYF